MENENQNLMSIKNYAQSCGVTIQTIYNRMKKNEIELEGDFINILKFPFKPAKKRGRKLIEKNTIIEAQSIS